MKKLSTILMFVACLALLAFTGTAAADGFYVEGGVAKNLTSETEYYGQEWLGEVEVGMQLFETTSPGLRGHVLFYGEHTSSIENGFDTGQNMTGVKYRLEFLPED